LARVAAWQMGCCCSRRSGSVQPVVTAGQRIQTSPRKDVHMPSAAEEGLPYIDFTDSTFQALPQVRVTCGAKWSHPIFVGSKAGVTTTAMSPPAQGDAFEIRTALDEGQYLVIVSGWRNPHHGVLDLSFDGKRLSPEGGLDWYGVGSAMRHTYPPMALEVGSAGQHTWRFETRRKNRMAHNYWMCLESLRVEKLSKGTQTLTLYHGTGLSIARKIEREGFLRSTTGCLGAGVYVAEKGKASRFAQAVHRHRGKPALLTLQVTVSKPKYVSGDDHTWQAQGFDACYTDHTSESEKPEWCLTDPKQAKVVKVEVLPAEADLRREKSIAGAIRNPVWDGLWVARGQDCDATMIRVACGRFKSSGVEYELNFEGSSTCFWWPDGTRQVAVSAQAHHVVWNAKLGDVDVGTFLWERAADD